MYSLEGTVLVQSSGNFVRLLIIITSRSVLKLGHVRLKTRSLGQILEKPSVFSRGHSFDHMFMKIFRMLIIIISRSDLKLGHGGTKTRSLGQILEKPCEHSRGHSFDSKVMKVYQIANHNI